MKITYAQKNLKKKMAVAEKSINNREKFYSFIEDKYISSYYLLQSQ